MKKVKIYGIVGETCAGKDTVAGIVSKNTGIGIVCSYTTNKQRSDQVNGVSHWFVSKEKFDDVMHNGTPVAYTQRRENGVLIEYGTTIEAMGNNRIYIINPDGIRWFNERQYDDIEIIPIYITLPLEERRERASKRNDQLDSFNARVESETKDFSKFATNKEYKYAFVNRSSADTAKLLTDIIKFEESKED